MWELVFFTINAILSFNLHGGSEFNSGRIDLLSINGKVCQVSYGTDVDREDFFEILPIGRSKVYQDREMPFYEIMDIMKKIKNR